MSQDDHVCQVGVDEQSAESSDKGPSYNLFMGLVALVILLVGVLIGMVTFQLAAAGCWEERVYAPPSLFGLPPSDLMPPLPPMAPLLPLPKEKPRHSFPVDPHQPKYYKI